MLNWKRDSEKMFLAKQLAIMDLLNTGKTEAPEHMNECSREVLKTGVTKI